MTLDEFCRVTPAIDLIVIYNVFDNKRNQIESYCYDSTKFLDELSTCWIPDEYYDYQIYNIRPLNDSQILVLIKDSFPFN